MTERHRAQCLGFHASKLAGDAIPLAPRLAMSFRQGSKKSPTWSPVGRSFKFTLRGELSHAGRTRAAACCAAQLASPPHSTVHGASSWLARLIPPILGCGALSTNRGDSIQLASDPRLFAKHMRHDNATPPLSSRVACGEQHSERKFLFNGD